MRVIEGPLPQKTQFWGALGTGRRPGGPNRGRKQNHNLGPHESTADPKVTAEAVYHYNPTKEPSGKSLEPHGPLPRSWPTFEEIAVEEAEQFADAYFHHRHSQSTVPPVSLLP